MNNHLYSASQMAADGISAVGAKHQAASRAFGVAVIRQGVAIGSAGDGRVSQAEADKLCRITETVGRQAYLRPRMKPVTQPFRAGGPLVSETLFMIGPVITVYMNLGVADVTGVTADVDIWQVSIDITDVDLWQVVIADEVAAAADEAAAAADEAAAAADEAAAAADEAAAAEAADVAAADAVAADVVDVVDLLVL